MSIELRRARNRQMIIFLLVCTSMVVLSSRLYYWQVMDSSVLARPPMPNIQKIKP